MIVHIKSHRRRTRNLKAIFMRRAASRNRYENLTSNSQDGKMGADNKQTEKQHASTVA